MPELEHIPSLRGPRPSGAVHVARKAPRQDAVLSFTAGMSRRSVLRGAITAGTALGFSALGVFPAARRAYADGYDIKPLPCPSYAGDHNCSPGCGPSYVAASNCNSRGWHRTDHPNAWTWYQLRPNQCVSGTGWDGWLWRFNGINPCNGCVAITYRCHDGRIITCSESSCSTTKSICRHRTACT